MTPKLPVRSLLLFCLLGLPTWTWAAPPAPVEEGGFTLAVLPGDHGGLRERPELYMLQTGWIAANAERHAIAHVLQTGVAPRDSREAWELARRAHRVYEGLVPAAYAPGHRETSDDPQIDAGDSLFSEYVTLAAYEGQAGFGGVYDREPDRTGNSWHTFQAGGERWLLLALEPAPRDDVLRWANAVVARHPDHAVILLTHAYRRTDTGPAADATAAQPYAAPTERPAGDANDGDAVWRKLVSRHPNFALVISDHPGAGAHLTSDGDHGNLVHQVLIGDGGTDAAGRLRLLQVLPDGRTVRVQDYAPLPDRAAVEVASEFRLMPLLAPPPPVLALPAPPPAPIPPTPSPWKSVGEVGFASARGNSTTQSFNGRLKTEYRRNAWTHAIDLFGLRASAELNVSDGEGGTRRERRTTANRRMVTVNSAQQREDDRQFTTALRYEADDFAPYAWQRSAALGYGSRLFEGDRLQMDLQVGPGYKQAHRALTEETESGFIGRGFVGLKYAVTENAELANTLLVEAGLDNTYAQNDLSLSVAMNSQLALKAGWQTRHYRDADAAFRTHNTDTLTTVNVVYRTKTK